MKVTILTGQAAIDHWRHNGGKLCRYKDATGPAKEGLTIEQAEEIASHDSRLIYLEWVERDADL